MRGGAQLKICNNLKGQLSLGLLGFSYFFGSLGLLLVNGLSYSSLAFVSYLSFLALPAVLISLYYQAVVIRQWCRFCLIVQAVLVAEVLTAFMGGFYTAPISIASIPLLALLFVLPILGWKLVRPLLDKEKEVNIYKRGLRKIKQNPDVLHGLLSRTRKISTPTDGLGIFLPSPDAKYNIIKVCNPYCGPCAEAHPILEELVAAGRINLQILFTARVGEEGTCRPVRHFLAIDEKGDKERTQQALDKWYNAEEKEYDSFAERYPMNGELLKQDEKIAAMRNWCDAEKITHTPTLFINGHELPKEYSVADLKEVLI